MKSRTKSKSKKKEAIVQVPLEALRCILRYPKEKKIICEIDTRSIRRINEAETVDQIINDARLDYALGRYKTFSNVRDLIAELKA